MRFFIPGFLSISRVFTASVFYVFLTTQAFPSVYMLLLLFVLIEASDFFDGMAARGLNAVSDTGKLLDPVCDVSAHFLCLLALFSLYVVPAFVLIIFVLREFWVMFFRTMLLRKTIVFAAQWSGKLKTWLYAIAIFFSIILLPYSPVYAYAPSVAQRALVYLQWLYYAATAVSLFSALHYAAVGIAMLRKKA